ncbi:MAG TPA: DNA topoisomerase IV subunit B [Alphaproteobacteria bacterium]|nr:DNA topoisomerase IV subunit B [Alphaproteobacteria bacterium]
MADLFSKAAKSATPKKSAAADDGYSAKHIEVLEGLEPVRRRPGMYIGGTDAAAMHHLVAEILDNSMDEVVAGYAKHIEIKIEQDNWVTIADDGRGIPVDPHPKFRNKSALEVILTTLHSGGKFDGKVYQTSGGLHGVGSSVVNALSDKLEVEVSRDKKVWRQDYSRGKPKGPLKATGSTSGHGTKIRFHPDPEIFGDKVDFSATRLFRMARAKAYLFAGAEVRWSCDASLIEKDSEVPTQTVLKFPGGLGDYLSGLVNGRGTLTEKPFVEQAELPDSAGRVEWAIAWPEDGEGQVSSYCNTVPTPEGGSHVQGLRSGLTRALKAYGDLTGKRGASGITADDVMDGAVIVLSLFFRNPQFQGQTKEKLASPEAGKLVEAVVKDHLDHWLTGDPKSADELLARIIERAEERARAKKAIEFSRKTATRKLRLPGKLADCSRENAEGTELFLVEGDSAGGSAKSARNRETQAILPLRGKILNVATASIDKFQGNQELADLVQAMGSGIRDHFVIEKLRYERVIIMTDADVDGAHIASLLITFFYREMRGLIEAGRLYLAQPPLYRLTQGGTTMYARDDAHKDELLKTAFKARGKVEISRFKGLGEMPPASLKETTMDPSKRTLLRVIIPKGETGLTATRVESLMGRKPELRLAFIQEHAREAQNLDV